MTRTENGSSPSDPDIAGLDALDDEHGPARPLSDRQLDLLSDGLAGRFSASTAARQQGDRVAREARRAGPAADGRRLRSRRAGPWLVVAAGATLATAAAALYATSWLTPAQPVSSTDRGGEAVREGAGGSEPSGRARTDAGADDDASNSRVDAAPPAAPAPPDASQPGGRPTSGPLTVPNRKQGSDEARHGQQSRRAEDHLARANALRGKHHYREALERYLYVVSEYPGSMQSRAAQLAAAAIRLEQLSDVDGAEALYRAVKNSSDGELAAQAVFGLADVARARGDRGAEARALRELLARHGGHPLAPAARRRLTALEAR